MYLIILFFTVVKELIRRIIGKKNRDLPASASATTNKTTISDRFDRIDIDNSKQIAKSIKTFWLILLLTESIGRALY